MEHDINCVFQKKIDWKSVDEILDGKRIISQQYIRKVIRKYDAFLITLINSSGPASQYLKSPNLKSYHTAYSGSINGIVIIFKFTFFANF